MEIKDTRKAMKAMNTAFKLANKSLNKSPERRAQCLALSKRLISAADKYVKANTPQP